MSLFKHWIKLMAFPLLIKAVYIALPIITAVFAANILGDFFNSVLNLDVESMTESLISILIILGIYIIVIPFFGSFKNILIFKKAIDYHAYMVGKLFQKKFSKTRNLGQDSMGWDVDISYHNSLMLDFCGTLAALLISLPFIFPMIYNNPTLGIVTIISCLPVIFLNIASAKKRGKIFGDEWKHKEQVMGFEMNIAGNHSFVRRNKISNAFVNIIETINDSYLKNTLSKNVKYKAFIEVLTSFLDLLSLGLVAFVAIFLFADNRLYIQDIVVYLALTIPVKNFIKNISGLIPMRKRISFLSKRVFDFLEDTEDGDGVETLQDVNLIESEKLNFSFDGVNNILKDVKIKVAKGDKILIEGANGSGKTTLVNIIAAIILSEEISANGKPYNAYTLNSIRGEISYINQQPYFFKGTILENLQIVNLDTEIEDMKRFIADFGIEKELDFQISPGGENLSGGERQKLSIIRGLLKKSHVFIFDEPTNNLDEASKQVLYDIFEKLDKTIIVISHQKDGLPRVGFKCWQI